MRILVVAPSDFLRRKERLGEIEAADIHKIHLTCTGPVFQTDPMTRKEI